LRVLEVEAQATLVAIDATVEDADTVRPVAENTCVVTGAMILDLDHVGAQICQMQGSNRTGQQARQVENAHTA
jgi:hypothetical protein